MKSQKFGKVFLAIALPAASFGIGWLLARPVEPPPPAPMPSAPRQQSIAEVTPGWEEDKERREKREAYLAELAEQTGAEWSASTARRLIGFARTDPAAVAPLVGRLADARRAEPTLAVAGYWAATDPAAALAWIDTLPGDDLAWNARRLALSSWASVDAAAALAHFQSLPDREKRALVDERLRSGETGWLKRVTERPGLASGRTFADELLLGLDAVQAEEVLALMDRSADSHIRQSAKLRRADDLFATDPAAAIALGGPDYAIRLAKTDPQAALKLAEDVKEVRASAIIGEWARHDPDAAFEHLSKAEGNRAPLLKAWRLAVAESDPESVAETYTRDLDEKPIRGNARFQTEESMTQGAMLDAWFARDPAAVTRWATSLTEHQGRTNARETLRKNWRQAGFENPEQFLIEHGYPAEEVAAP